MTVTQKHEIETIVDSLDDTLAIAEAGSRIDITGIREEEVILIRDLLKAHLRPSGDVSQSEADGE